LLSLTRGEEDLTGEARNVSLALPVAATVPVPAPTPLFTGSSVGVFEQPTSSAVRVARSAVHFNNMV
jgi:hypothetical protein